MRFFGFVVLWVMVWTMFARAEPIEFARNVADIKIFDASVAVPWWLSAETHPTVSGALRISGVAEIGPVLDALEKGLVAELARQSDGCETRVKAYDPTARIKEDGRLAVAVTARYERWLCQKVLGRNLTTKLASETGRLRAEVAPEVISGRVQVRLMAFQIDGLSEISRMLNVEDSLRKDLQKAADDFNRDLAATALPHEVALEGFAYEHVAWSGAPEWRLTATIAGPDSATCS